MRIQNDIDELQEAGLISEETAQQIKAYYQGKSGQGNNRLFAIFGVLGAVLIGMGIVLIIAHNWEDLSKPLKTFFAFLPLVLGQLAAAYALLKQEDSVAWKEGSAAFIFFALASCISLISQIYNISGDLASFLLVWMLLALPMIYVLRSSIVGVFYLLGITYYACEIDYFKFFSNEEWNWYGFLLLALLPHYFMLSKQKLKSNFLSFFNWLIPLSITICLGIVAKSSEEWMALAYVSLFSAFYLFGKSKFLDKMSLLNNGFELIGSFGSIVVLLAATSRSAWRDFQSEDFNIESQEFMAYVLLTLFTLVLLVNVLKLKSWKDVFPFGFIFLIFIPIFLIGMQTSLVVILVNLFVLFIGVWTVKTGADEERIGLLNFGLMIIMVLIALRFFDVNISFVLRGLIFVALGLVFFFTNYWMIKKIKKHEG